MVRKLNLNQILVRQLPDRPLGTAHLRLHHHYRTRGSLFRALRVDKLTYAALEATLLAYVKRDDAVPVLRMMRLSKDEMSGGSGRFQR